jgi:hypothetical protein
MGCDAPAPIQQLLEPRRILHVLTAVLRRRVLLLLELRGHFVSFAGAANESSG